MSYDFRNRLQNGNMFKMLYIARKLIWLSKDTKVVPTILPAGPCRIGG